MKLQLKVYENEGEIWASILKENNVYLWDTITVMFICKILEKNQIQIEKEANDWFDEYLIKLKTKPITKILRQYDTDLGIDIDFTDAEKESISKEISKNEGKEMDIDIKEEEIKNKPDMNGQL